MVNYYSILEIPENASLEQIKIAYRKKALQLHPDVCKDSNASLKFMEVNEAYRVLTDPNFKPKVKPPKQKPPVVRWDNKKRGIRHVEVKNIDLWAQMGNINPWEKYWKEYSRLKASMVYDSTEEFWSQLDEWAKNNM